VNPSLLLIGLIGLPGSGKTCAAHIIEDRFATAFATGEGRLRCIIISRDDTRAAMFPNGTASAEEKATAFRECLSNTDTALEHGCSVILDGCTFARQADRDRVQKLAEKHGIRATWIHMDCDTNTARERIAVDLDQSAHNAPDRTPDLVDRVAAAFDPPPVDAIVVNARQPEAAVEAQLRHLLTLILRGTFAPPVTPA
jgi:predicted kinase